MATSGKWEVQNKIRPGAYVRTKIVPSTTGVTSGKGVCAIGLTMSWGEEGTLIECNSTDYFLDEYISKLGVSVNDTTNALPYTLALSDCYKAYFYRLNSGGTKASATFGTDGTYTAKCSGDAGNKISLVITADKPVAGKSLVEVLFDGVRQEKYVVSTIAEFEAISSEWVTIDAGTETSIPATAGTTLTGGTNGTVGATALSSFFSSLTYKNVNTVAVNDSTSSTQQALRDYIIDARDNKGKCVRGVCVGITADHEGVTKIPADHGFKTADYEVTPSLLTIAVAGWIAGCNYNESLTAKTITDATEIVGAIAEDNIETYLEQGYFILTYNIDGSICVEEDINSLTTFTNTKPESFRKNQVISVLDYIQYNQVLIFTTQYCGKFTNTDTSRQSYKSQIIVKIYDYLLSLGAIQEYDSADDIVVGAGTKADSAVCDCWFTPIEAWEKLYITNNLRF